MWGTEEIKQIIDTKKEEWLQLPDKFEDTFKNLDNKKKLVNSAKEGFDKMDQKDKQAITDKTSTEIRSWWAMPKPGDIWYNAKIAVLYFHTALTNPTKKNPSLSDVQATYTTLTTPETKKPIDNVVATTVIPVEENPVKLERIKIIPSIVSNVDIAKQTPITLVKVPATKLPDIALVSETDIFTQIPRPLQKKINILIDIHKEKKETATKLETTLKNLSNTQQKINTLTTENTTKQDIINKIDITIQTMKEKKISKIYIKKLQEDKKELNGYIAKNNDTLYWLSKDLTDQQSEISILDKQKKELETNLKETVLEVNNLLNGEIQNRNLTIQQIPDSNTITILQNQVADLTTLQQQISVANTPAWNVSPIAWNTIVSTASIPQSGITNVDNKMEIISSQQTNTNSDPEKTRIVDKLNANTDIQNTQTQNISTNNGETNTDRLINYTDINALRKSLNPDLSDMFKKEDYNKRLTQLYKETTNEDQKQIIMKEKVRLSFQDKFLPNDNLREWWKSNGRINQWTFKADYDKSKDALVLFFPEIWKIYSYTKKEFLWTNS